MSDYIPDDDISIEDLVLLDYMQYSLYKFLCELKKDCMPPKIYNLTSDLTKIEKFWEID
jgi:hypothetical protein